MTHTNMAIGITVLVTAFTIPPCSWADHEPTRAGDVVHWVNPDGSKGMTTTISAVSHGAFGWANPDGTEGVTERYSGLAPGSEYAWANPDGYSKRSMKALNEGEHASVATATVQQTDIARYTEQQLYQETKRNGPINMLTFLLAMLVGGSMLLLTRNLWPH